MDNSKITQGDWKIKRMGYDHPGHDGSWFIYVDENWRLDSGRELVRQKLLFSPGGDAGSTFSPEPYNGYGMTKEDAELVLKAVKFYREHHET